MTGGFNYIFLNDKIIIPLVMHEYVYAYVFTLLQALNCAFSWAH